MAHNYRDLPDQMDFSEFNAIRLCVATNEDILSWSYGEVLKPETINYRTQKPEKDGLFDETIFGPVKDINPFDTRFKGARGRNLAVDKKGAIVTKSIVRRERMGHIGLAVPIVHIWFLRVAPSPLSYITGMTVKALEKVIYFAVYLVLEVNEDLKAQLSAELTKIYEEARKVLFEKPLDNEKLEEKLFDYFLKAATKKPSGPPADIWDLLIRCSEEHAKHKDLIAELRKHGLLDFSQMAALDDDLTALEKLFTACPKLRQQSKPYKLYRQFVEFEATKEKAEAPKLEAGLKAEFRKVRKLFETLFSHFKLTVEDFNAVYTNQHQRLVEGLVTHNLITETEYRNLPSAYRKVARVGMGGEAVFEMLRSIDLKELTASIEIEIADSKGQKRAMLLKRLKVLKGMERAGIIIEDFCLRALPVIPPNLRPIIQLSGGRFATSDLNDLYRRVINRNNRLKKLQELKAPEVICRNEKRMLQEAVDALIDNSQQRSARVATTGSQQRKLKSLADILRHKHGRLRQNLLGKRVDYSGRSVIVVGPDLHISECGLPKIIALELFKPFVIGYLLAHDYANNIRLASRLIDSGENVVWDALDQVIQGKLVLLNRAPSLHRLSVQAFKPKLIEGKAIQLHPLVCRGFNADFDGDQMSVHLPLSEMAQAEARELMVPARNLLHPADGSPIINFDQDIVVGLFYLTYFKEPEAEVKRHFASTAEAVFALEQDLIELQTKIGIIFRGEHLTTSLGRVFLNELLPEDLPFQNYALDKDAIKAMMANIHEAYDNDATVEIADALKALAFKYATSSGISVGMADFFGLDGCQQLQEKGVVRTVKINEQYLQGLITDAERYRLTVENWFDVDKAIQALVDEQFPKQKTSFSLIVESKAQGKINIGQIKKIMASLGVVNDTSGRPLELSINSNLYIGLPVLEYFVSARGARKSLIDVALSTADSGHLTRRLVYVSQGVITVDDDPKQVDPGFEVLRSDSEEMGTSLYKRLINRFAAEDIKLDGKVLVPSGELITKEAAQVIEESNLAGIKILSSLSAPNLGGIPTKSYGIDLANGELVAAHHPIGVIAAQSIGEPSTQLKLDSKHGGGQASAAVHAVNTGLNRVEELFEARSPKGQSYLAPFAGRVAVNELNYDFEILVKADEEAVWHLPIDDCEVLVKLDQAVSEGELLAIGANQAALLAPIEGLITALDKNQLTLKPLKPLEARFLISKSQQLLVKNNQKISRGAALNEGSIKLDELLGMRGIVATQRYILTEISKVFAQQGTHISDKHLEVIIRQMFSRLQVVKSGDSRFIDGDIVSKRILIEENENLIAEGRRPAVWRQLALGITKVSILSDSFLVAASFQDTTRILVSSSINGRVDHLHGLIENVILGRKIPVGTGALKNNPVDEDFEDL